MFFHFFGSVYAVLGLPWLLSITRALLCFVGYMLFLYFVLKSIRQ